MIDDNQKRFVPHLANETELFHCAFANPFMMYNKWSSQSGVRLTAHLAIECIMGNYCTSWRPCVKGLSLNGGRVDFSKKPPRRFFLMKIYGKMLIWAGSISVDSTFNSTNEPQNALLSHRLNDKRRK
jgi:hypothetical protein